MELQLGLLAHLYGKQPVKDLAKKVGADGFRSVQLALAKALSDIDSSLGRLSPGLANYIGETFDREGVRIGVLGCYIDMINPDADKRRYDLNRFKEHLRFARDFGTGLVASEMGHPVPGRHPDEEWQLLKESVEELAEAAEKYGVLFTIEPAQTHIIDTTESMLRILEDVPSDNIGVLLDCCNLTNIGNIHDNTAISRDAFAKLADRLVLIHAKDAYITEQGEKKNCDRIGTGLMDVETVLREVYARKPYIDVSMEGVALSEITASRDYLRELYARIAAE